MKLFISLVACFSSEMAASAPSYAHMLPGYGVLVSRFDRPSEPWKVNFGLALYFDSINTCVMNKFLCLDQSNQGTIVFANKVST